MDWNLQMTMARDPVCGMEVNPQTAAFRVDHDGQTYFFCSRGCMLDFQEEPGRYLDPSYEPQGMEDMGGHGGHTA
jgi:YHS domain-containing protein